jgi:hypothetical protein
LRVNPCRQVALAGPAWEPPTGWELGGRLLQAEEKSVKQLMAAKRDVAAASAATMVGDGALNVTGTPILNLLILQNGQVEFYRAQNCAGKVKDAQFIADDFIAAIRAQQRPRDVVYVLTDGACKKSWPNIEEACPWVTWLVHAARL